MEFSFIPIATLEGNINGVHRTSPPSQVVTDMLGINGRKEKV